MKGFVALFLAAFTLIAALVPAVAASANGGHAVRQRVVVQRVVVRQPIIRQRVVVQRQQVYAQPVYVQPVVVQQVQQYCAPAVQQYYAPQQVVTPGCQSFFAR